MKENVGETKVKVPMRENVGETMEGIRGEGRQKKIRSMNKKVKQSGR